MLVQRVKNMSWSVLTMNIISFSVNHYQQIVSYGLTRYNAQYTAGPCVMLLCLRAFNYNVNEKNKLILPRTTLCGACMSSPCLCRFSPWTLVSFHIPKMCMCSKWACLNCHSLSECEGVCEWSCDGRASCTRLVPLCSLTYLDRLWPP